jgi:hypothetical protein
MNSNTGNTYLSEAQFLFNIIKSVEHQINRNLLELEENLIIKCVKTVYIKTFKEDDIRYQQLFKHVTTKIIEELHLTQCEETAVVDTHEILKRHIGKTSEIEYMPTFEHEGHTEEDEKRELNNVPSTKVEIGSIFGLSDIREVIGKMSETTSIKHAYFMLDTKYRCLDNDGTKYFKWDNINSVTRSQGTINMLGSIRDIVSMRTYPLRIPNVATAYTPYERISIFVEEFIAQSYIVHENRNFHFIGGSEIKGNWVNICPDDYNEGCYNFDKPITHIDNITISFASPLEPIIFDKDRLPTTIIEYGSTTTLQTSEINNLLPGDIIYISDFNTNSINDSVITNYFNRQAGHSVTILTPTTFSIPVDTSSFIASEITGVINTPNSIIVGTVIPTFNSNIIVGIGTSFTTDYVVNGNIQIFDQVNSVYVIIEIIDDTHLIIDSQYTILLGLNTNYNTTTLTDAVSLLTNIFDPIIEVVAGVNTFSHSSTTSIIIGVGTSFTTDLKPGDIISINAVDTPNFIVGVIESDISLTITSVYNGLIGDGLTVNKNNINESLSFSTFFGSKRIFIPIELTYISSD